MSALASGLLSPHARELFAHGLRAAPHLNRLDATAAVLAHSKLTLDARLVEQPQGGVNGGRGGGVTEAMSDQQAPVPVVVGVRLCVAGDQIDGGVDVARLVGQAQVELEVGPVVRERIDDPLEGVGEAHRREP